MKLPIRARQIVPALVVSALTVPALAVMALAPGPAAGQAPSRTQPTPVPVTAWEVLLPDGGYPTLPLLLPEIDYTEENDLRSLAFGCSGDRYYLFVIAPGFPYEAVNPAELRLDGGELTLQLRDLYAAPARAAPQVDWDADVLYADISRIDLSRLQAMDATALAIGGRAWALPLPGFAQSLPEFLAACAGGTR